MKIVLLTPAYPLRGGIAASSERLARELRAMGYDVVIYSFSLQYPAFLFPGKTQYSSDPAPSDLVIKTHLNSIHPWSWITTARAIAREQPNCVVVRFWLPFLAPCLGTVARLVRRWSNAPVRITALVDNIIPHEKRIGDRLLAKFFVRSCDDFVVMSRAVGEDIRQFLGEPVDESTIRFAPHPVYDIYGSAIDRMEARRRLGVPADVPLVLFFGFIRPYKGLDLLLEALSEAPHVHAVIAGECYGGWEGYQALIDKYHLQQRLYLYLNFIPSEMVNVYFSSADLVVQPYKSATQSGISQIAYHFEKPMLVTTVGGLPEIVKHGTSGYVVSPDAKAIAEAMRDFFEHDRAQSFAEGARVEKMRFSWKYLAEAVIKDIKS